MASFTDSSGYDYKIALQDLSNTNYTHSLTYLPSTISTSVNSSFYVTSNIEEDDKMTTKYLYHLMVIDFEGQILLDRKIVSASQKDAEFELGVDTLLRDKNLKPSEVNIICNSFGNVKVNKCIAK